MQRKNENNPLSRTNFAGDDGSIRPDRTLLDMLIIALLLTGAILVASAGPSTTHAYAQLNNIGSAVAMERTGDYLTPRNHVGNLPRKGPLLYWFQAGLIKITGVRSDFIFRIPTILSAMITAGLIYLLACRWFSRATGLLAACLWITMLHMSKQLYVGLTDMMLTMWITIAIFCADKLLFHRTERIRRWRWAIGLWGAMTLAALTKGWGIVNFSVVGGFVCLAGIAMPGFSILRKANRFTDYIFLTLRVIFRRLIRTIKATKLPWLLPPMLAITGGMLWLMIRSGGEDYIRDALGVEFGQRISGGISAPRATSTPAWLNLIYYTLPASIFAIGALFMVHPKKWFSRKGSICLPLCWILVTVAAFSIPHGFRPDYLLPCYGAVAILGAWAIEEFIRRDRCGGRIFHALRHVFAACPVIIGFALAGGAVLFGFHAQMPEFIQKSVSLPFYFSGGTKAVLWSMGVIGLLIMGIGIWASLAWRFRIVAAASVIGMLGVFFLDTHIVSPPARMGDGQKMLIFTRQAKKIIADDDFFSHAAEKLSVELYTSKAGLALPADGPEVASGTETNSQKRDRIVRNINRMSHDTKWFLTCDRGLVELGAAEENPRGNYNVKIAGVKRFFHIHPELLGEVALKSPSIKSQRWGRIYLIKLKPDIVITAPALFTDYMPGNVK